MAFQINFREFLLSDQLECNGIVYNVDLESLNVYSNEAVIIGKWEWEDDEKTIGHYIPLDGEETILLDELESNGIVYNVDLESLDVYSNEADIIGKWEWDDDEKTIGHFVPSQGYVVGQEV